MQHDIIRFFYMLLMQSSYLVDRVIIDIGYDFVISTSKADMNPSDRMLVKVNVPFNSLKPFRADHVWEGTKDCQVYMNGIQRV